MSEKRQQFIDNTNDIKIFTNDPEKNYNKLSKDDKKKLEKLYIETLDWIEKNKQNTTCDISAISSKMKEVDNVFQPIVDACRNASSGMA